MDTAEDAPLISSLVSRLREIVVGNVTGERVDGSGARVCYYCGKATEELQAEHVVASARGGSDSPYCMVWACAACNHSKGAKHPLNWTGIQNLPDDLFIDYMARILLGAHEQRNRVVHRHGFYLFGGDVSDELQRDLDALRKTMRHIDTLLAISEEMEPEPPMRTRGPSIERGVQESELIGLLVERLRPWWAENGDKWGAKSAAARYLWGDGAVLEGHIARRLDAVLRYMFET
jgi:hypothetical protein